MKNQMRVYVLLFKKIFMIEDIFSKTKKSNEGNNNQP